MNSNQRRIEIQTLLQQSAQPVSAGAMAERFHVSRQVIVGDIALLRAADVKISATPRGYILLREEDQQRRYIIACRHDNGRLADELYTVVDNGGRILDVIVEHAVYGQISGQLQICSRYDADEFIKALSESHSVPLSNLTGGIHLHTIACPTEECYQRILTLLEQQGILLTTKKA